MPYKNLFSIPRFPDSRIFIPALLIYAGLTAQQVFFLAQDLKNTSDTYSQILAVASFLFLTMPFLVSYMNFEQDIHKKRWFALGLNLLLLCLQIWLGVAALDWLTQDSYPQDTFAYLGTASLAFTIQLLLGGFKQTSKVSGLALMVYALIFGLLFQKVFNADVRFLQIISLVPVGFGLVFNFSLLRSFVHRQPILDTNSHS